MPKIFRTLFEGNMDKEDRDKGVFQQTFTPETFGF